MCDFDNQTKRVTSHCDEYAMLIYKFLNQICIMIENKKHAIESKKISKPSISIKLTLPCAIDFIEGMQFHSRQMMTEINCFMLIFNCSFSESPDPVKYCERLLGVKLQQINEIYETEATILKSDIARCQDMNNFNTNLLKTNDIIKVSKVIQFINTMKKYAIQYNLILHEYLQTYLLIIKQKNHEVPSISPEELILYYQNIINTSINFVIEYILDMNKNPVSDKFICEITQNSDKIFTALDKKIKFIENKLNKLNM